ncbi:MAG: head GIN domain-containing protein [Bacteroidota bacterium]
MKNILLIVLFTGITGLLAAQSSETRSVGSFNGVKAAEGVDVYLKKGDKENVKVEVTGTSIENVITEVSGSYLKVHMKDGRYRSNVDVKVFVTYVQLEKISASSAGSIFSEGVIKSARMDINASSAGTVEVQLDAGTLEATASSAGDMELKGKAKNVTFEVSSAGEVDADDLEAESVNAEASSAGSAKINVTKSLVAHASSGGSIRYRGNPDKSITESSSGGSVKKSN